MTLGDSVGQNVRLLVDFKVREALADARVRVEHETSPGCYAAILLPASTPCAVQHDVRWQGIAANQERIRVIKTPDRDALELYVERYTPMGAWERVPPKHERDYLAHALMVMSGAMKERP